VRLSQRIGNRLRELREARGFTQLAVEIRSGVPARTLRSWEHGEALASLDLLGAVAEALDIPLADLIRSALGLDDTASDGHTG